MRFSDLNVLCAQNDKLFFACAPKNAREKYLKTQKTS